MSIQDRVASWLSLVNSLLQGIGGALLIGLLVVICLDVASRYLLGQPFHGVTELVEQAIVALVCLSAPAAIERHNFVRSDGLLVMLDNRKPALSRLLKAIFYFAGAIMFLLVAVAIYPRMTSAYSRGLYVGIEGLATIPIWPGLASIFVGALFSALAFLILILNVKREIA